MGFGSSEIRTNKRKRSLVHCGVLGAWGFLPAPPIALEGATQMLLLMQVDPEWPMQALCLIQPLPPGLGSFPDK